MESTSIILSGLELNRCILYAFKSITNFTFPKPMDSDNENPTPPATQSMNPENEKLVTVLTHITPLAGFFFPALGMLLGPLIWWAIMKDKSDALHSHTTEVLNLAISYTIYTFVCIPLVFILIGIPLLITLVLGMIVCIIIGAIKAAEGQLFRYPLIIRFLKVPDQEF